VLSTLRRGAYAILERNLTDDEVESFRKYLELLRKWQSVHRLLGSSEIEWIVERILLDSLLFRRILPESARDIVDAGSGAGVPGIPLKIVDRELKLTLVESRQRRVSFLSTAVRELALTGIDVRGDRLEALVRPFAGCFDAVVARCAGDVGYLFGIGIYLVRPGGVVIASGPPKEHPLPAGHWVTVPGIRAGQSRRFAVFKRP
jgi:16S rRNA (guanine527-N7)-methyltransferase